MSPDFQYAESLKILGLYSDEDAAKLPENLKDSEIEQAYRKLALKHHPDRRGGDEKKFILLTAAKDFLVNGGAADMNTRPCPNNSADEKSNGKMASSSRVLLYGRGCVRDVDICYDAITNKIMVVGATDEGLKMVSCSGERGGLSKNQLQIGTESILCCALSLDGQFVFVGTSKGAVCRYYLKVLTHKHVHVSPVDDSEILETLIAYPLGRNKFDSDLSSPNVVSIKVQDESIQCTYEYNENENTNEHIVAAACDSPRAVTIFRFKSMVVETLWKISDSTSLSKSINSIETLEFGVNSMPQKRLKDTYRVWLGGSNQTNEAVLINWKVSANICPMDDHSHTQEEDEDEGEEDCWSECSESDSDNTIELDTPINTINLGHGSVYSLDESHELGVIAATVGSSIIILGALGEVEREELYSRETKNQNVCVSFQRRKTLTTKDLLYCVKILSKSRKVAACGAGESITIWSLAKGTVEHTIHLNTMKHCNLSTNCMMSLRWVCQKDNSVSIVSGGYDGNITQWFFDLDKHQISSSI